MRAHLSAKPDRSSGNVSDNPSDLARYGWSHSVVLDSEGHIDDLDHCSSETEARSLVDHHLSLGMDFDAVRVRDNRTGVLR